MAEPRMSAGAIVLQGLVANLGSASSKALFVAPEAGYIKELHCVRGAAGGSGTTDLTIVTALGSVAPVLTLLTAGAAGDIDSLDLGKEDTNNHVASGEGFSVDSDGDFGGTPEGQITVVLETY